MTEMNGNIFQIHSEQQKKGQFQETMDALKVYASITYKKDINYLTPLFTNLEEPQVDQPDKPTPTVQVKDEKGQNLIEDGKPVMVTTRFEDMLFQEQVKQYMRDITSLSNTLQSLYNIVWGQCSKLMQN